MTESKVSLAGGAFSAAVPLFTLTVFTSATLLFAIQPMFTKMVLPQLGGSPAVWSVAMVVFQSLLLAGYAYAHGLHKWAPGRAGLLIHVAVTLLAALTLPFAVRWKGAPPVDGEIFWLIGLFLVSVGAPFFALSANGPLLQTWFTRSGDKGAGDPWFLYAASNVGSFLALLAYPLLIEPFFTLGSQRWLWSYGFFVLALLIALCAAMIWRVDGVGANARKIGAEAEGAVSAPLAISQILTWIALSAVPSGLLVAVTAHISTDVASAPFLWVIPLALYLLTFVVVFQKRPIISHRLMLLLQPIVTAAILASLMLGYLRNFALVLAIHLVGFFVIAMACHGELVKRRPAVTKLTAFYLCMSIGGLVGGLFSGLLAPNLFSWVLEYPLLVVLAIVFWPWRTLLAEPGAAQSRPLLASLALGLVLIGAQLVVARDQIFAGGSRQTVRSFFGVHKIRETADGRFRFIEHGTTVHGVQVLKDAAGKPITGRPIMSSYYYDGSPLSEALDHARKTLNRPLRVAVIGLGAGSFVCRSAPGDSWIYFEIDAAVVRIAKDRTKFNFIERCMPDLPIVIGDARLTIAAVPDASYDVLFVDAFSSESIPVHLLTREAMALYKAKVVPGGFVVLHITNLHMELASVAAGIAAANGMVTAVRDSEITAAQEAEYLYPSTVAVTARDAALLKELIARDGWDIEEPRESQPVWTDDYSNIVGAIIRNYYETEE